MVPDYYAMLGLDHRADRPTIEAALQRCQPEWSSKTRHPSKGTLYQSYLDQIPEIRKRLLGDPGERSVYDAELTAGRRAERQAQMDELQRLVRLRAAKGGLTVTDRGILRQEADRLGLSKDDLDRLAEPFPPVPEAPADPDVEDDEPPPSNVIEPATRRQIRIALDHLKKRDLYDLLGLRRDSPAAEIAARAATERVRWMQKAQVTAEKTAWLNAVSLAQSHLTSPEARARYDRTLALEAEEGFRGTIVFALKGLPRLDPGTKDALLQEASALGLAADRAERLIRIACRKAGIVAGSGPAPVNAQADRRWLRCRECSGLTEYTWAEIHSSGECRHCRASLKWDCPSCRRTAWVDERHCHHCGFAIENLDPLIRHFEAAQHAHRLRRLEEALEHLKRVQEFAPHHVGARKGLEKVGEQLAQVRRLRALTEAEITRRRLVSARAAAEAWSRLVASDDPEVRAVSEQIQAGLLKAGDLASRARAAIPEDTARARTLFRKALAVAADLPDAHEGLRACPPDGPSDLRAEVSNGRVRLRWTAPKPDGVGPVAYRILRKRQQAPSHAEDGLVVAEVAATEWEDPNPTPGDSFGYAVFSTRHSVSSLQGVSAGPFLVAEDVRDVRVEARAGEVRLSWSAPPGMLGVRVVRKPGAPVEGPRDGIPIEALGDSALDRGLDDGRVYHYGLFALWRGPDGRPHPSRGVFVSAVPQPPAHPVNDLRLGTAPDGRLRLRWTPPSLGHVKILKTPHAPTVPTGERRSAAEFERLDLGGTWLDAVAVDHAFDVKPEGLGLAYYTPVTFAAGLATVGRSVSFSHVPDPSDLRVARAGRSDEAIRVHLRWRWDPRGTQCLVVARRGHDPDGPDDPEALTFSAREEEYSRLRHFAIELPHSPDATWHLRVYTVANLDGQTLISPGLEPSSRAVLPGPIAEVTVSYDLKPPLIPGRRWTIAFRTEPPGSPIPPTALVAHPRTIPLSPDDGPMVAQFPACRDGDRLSFRPSSSVSSHCLRLFPDPSANPDGLPPIRLRHPEAGATRV
jgi:hypothetical protein